MNETYKGKEVIDIVPSKEIEETTEEMKTETPAAFFTVTAAGKNRPIHMVVKASSALEALEYVQEKNKCLVLAVHITEYSKYLDASESEDTVKASEGSDE